MQSNISNISWENHFYGTLCWWKMLKIKLSFKCILCIWAKMDTVLLCWVSNSIFEIIIHPVDRNLIIWLKQKLLAKDNFFFVDVSSNSFKITKLLIQSILNCKWITACVKATMSILNNKKKLIVCQLLLSTLAFGLFQVGR